MVAENVHVQTQRAEMQSSYEQGFWEGYEAYGQPLPAWYSQATATLLLWDARKRGYFVGREVRAIEHRYADDLAGYWPTLDGVPEGNDIFPHLPITGAPQEE
jgi:hypothetical protein